MNRIKFLDEAKELDTVWGMYGINQGVIRNDKMECPICAVYNTKYRKRGASLDMKDDEITMKNNSLKKTS